MDYHSEKHKELSEQLTTWWQNQTDFQTKKALAGSLKVHPDTLGDYFSGRKFPKSDIASRLYELSHIKCLEPDVDGNTSSEVVPQESSATPPVPHFPGVAASIEEPQELHDTGSSGPLKEGSHSEKSPGVIAGQPSGELTPTGERYGERAVVISLQRTRCPFCGHDITGFRRCVNCGQEFVWANVPLEHGEPM